tara:strand:+ start:119 stop:436 length:318 start_codon:yes stop_codon:yes gene_type:complete
MASNIKWFKRAYRALNSGQHNIWEAIKVKLSDDRIEFLEKTFLQMPESSTKEQQIEPKTTKAKTKTTKAKTKTTKTKTIKTKTTKPKAKKSKRIKKNEKLTEQNN